MEGVGKVIPIPGQQIPGFSPPVWLKNPHLQTLWGKFCRKRANLGLQQVRWDTPDGDFLDLFRLAAPSQSFHLVILHGLEGTIRSHYVNGLFQESRRRGWSADLIVFRSCGDEINRTERFYHSGETQDLKFVLDKLIAEDPDRSIGLIGVSLGGNVLLKYLGESGDNVPTQVVAAAAVSVPFDLARGSRFISRGFSRVYERHFIQSLKSKVAAKLAQLPAMKVAADWSAAGTLYDFDDKITAPLHGFLNADDYYSRSSAIGYLGGIRINTLLLSSYDDPFLPSAVLDEVRNIANKNPSITVEFHEHGGHVGFVAKGPFLSPRYYMEKQVTGFLAGQPSRDT